MRSPAATVVLTIVCLNGAASLATTVVYVNGSAGNNAWDGLCEVWDGGTCGPKATIQAGIDAAGEGDTVIVADGSYAGDGNRDLDFGGKAITLRSANGPNNCIIDCEANWDDLHRGFHFHSGETADSIIDGLTITNGYHAAGGGVCCEQSSPTVTNCAIVGNAAYELPHGGYGGGGIYCLQSSPTITNCEIVDNSAYDYYFGGGGIYCEQSDPTVANCTFSGNDGSYYGGGITCIVSSHPMITNCTFTGGEAASGGGIYCNYESSPTIANCTVVENTATCGGGLVFEGGSPTVVNCTIADNVASEDGGGVWCGGDSQPVITNCIFWADTPEEIHVHDTNSPVVSYCDIQGGWEGEGNIDADPLFADPDEDDYHLTAGSPCVDTGDPDFVAEPGQTDIDGQARVWDGDGDDVSIVDIGSDEFSSFAFGDLNCDGAVNNFDIDPFVLALTSASHEPPFDDYCAVYPDCDGMLADVNGDGVVNNFDIDPFVAILLSK